MHTKNDNVLTDEKRGQTSIAEKSKNLKTNVTLRVPAGLGKKVKVTNDQEDFIMSDSTHNVNAIRTANAK